jgi:hypothetical protein
LDLSKLEGVPGSSRAQTSNGPVIFEIQPAAGAYGALSPTLRAWCGTEFPYLLTIDLVADVESIGVALLSEDTLTMLGRECRLMRADGRLVVGIRVDERLADGRLVIRNYGTSDRSPRARVYAA